MVSVARPGARVMAAKETGNIMVGSRAAALYAGAVVALLSSGVAFAQGAPAIKPEYAQSWAAYQAMKAAAKPPQLPNWGGIWRRAPGGSVFSFDASGPNPRLPNYGASAAKLTPKYKAAYEAKVERVVKGIEWDRLSYCLPVGMPRFLTEPWLREFFVTPEVTVMIHEQISEVRRIYTDGKQHTPPGEVPPLWEGESIGFWDGDTLVIHTTNLKAGEYQRGQPDYSFKTSTVERVRMTNPTTIVDDITVYDPESLLEPYKASFTFRKVTDPTVRINFGSCEEGNNAVITPEGGTTYILPGEKDYRDPDTLGIPEVALDSLPK